MDPPAVNVCNFFHTHFTIFGCCGSKSPANESRVHTVLSEWTIFWWSLPSTPLPRVETTRPDSSAARHQAKQQFLIADQHSWCILIDHVWNTLSSGPGISVFTWPRRINSLLQFSDCVEIHLIYRSYFMLQTQNVLSVKQGASRIITTAALLNAVYFEVQGRVTPAKRSLEPCTGWLKKYPTGEYAISPQPVVWF